MNEDVKREWVKALRSGDFKQGKGCLYTGQSYCCLGVLTELYRQQHGGEWFKIDPSWDAVYFNGRDGYCLPDEVSQWAGLSSNNPIILRQDINEETSLAGLNDEGITFEAIASLIEEYL